jgi:hypothetical protein
MRSQCAVPHEKRCLRSETVSKTTLKNVKQYLIQRLDEHRLRHVFCCVKIASFSYVHTKGVSSLSFPRVSSAGTP